MTLSILGSSSRLNEQSRDYERNDAAPPLARAGCKTVPVACFGSALATEHRLAFSASDRLRPAVPRSDAIGLSREPRTPIETSIFSPASAFADIGAEAASAMARVAVRRRFAANAFIYIQDDAANFLYVVLSGHVRLSYMMEDGSAVLHAIVPPGESFGELGVFENGTYADMATASGAVQLACIPAAAFRQLSGDHAGLFHGLSRAVARRYRSYIVMTRDLSLKSLAARLAQALIRLADGLGRTVTFRGRQVSCIGAMVTQTDLGLMARGSRGNVNRALKTWERAGWIAFDERRIMILDRSSLDSLSIEGD